MTASEKSLQGVTLLPALECGEIHVWHAALDDTANSMLGFVATLSADERAKAASFRCKRDCTRYVAGRGILRSLLGSYLHIEPESLRFSYGPFGKPFLDTGSSPCEVHFNVSHAGGRALFAFARDQEIGVDVEYVQPSVDFERLAKSVFPPREFAELQSYAAAQRLPEFFRLWTRLEALAKACGMGLSLLDGGAAVSSDWNVGHFYPEPGYVAAIAAKSNALKVRYYAYPFPKETLSLHF